MAKPRKSTRNPELAKGVRRFSRSVMYHKRGLWAIKAKNGGSFPAHGKIEKPAPAEPKAPKYYPAEDAPKPLKNRHKIRPTKLRSSITPGTILILLVGRFKGKRVVFLKQLESGLLLVTGPYKINGVPLRRVNQAYVIATSTKVDISSMDVSKFNDSMFQRSAEKKKKGEDQFFDSSKEDKKAVTQEKKDDQAAVDTPLMKLIGQMDSLKEYIGARFSLKRGMKPHELVF